MRQSKDSRDRSKDKMNKYQSFIIVDGQRVPKKKPLTKSQVTAMLGQANHKDLFREMKQKEAQNCQGSKWNMIYRHVRSPSQLVKLKDMIDRSYERKDDAEQIIKDQKLTGYLEKKRNETEERKKPKVKEVKKVAMSKKETMMLEGDSKEFF